ncbi:MAG: hypothetical protein IPN49_16145 [Saprospiraceae bacterium]|nr:hypothetical protein [Saprospiraceae bacterium]MBK8820530.1 hypothetical protein [Saprospiraceae bacterium]
MRGIVLVLFITIMMSCKTDKSTSETSFKAETSQDTVDQNTPQETNSDWTVYEGAENKKPAEVSLFEAKGLQTRLKSMLKDEYTTFQKDWKVESPIIIQDKILFTAGCQSGDCKANKYILIIDFMDNNINIINFKYGRVRSWEERAVIGLPDKLLAQFESIRKDQGL